MSPFKAGAAAVFGIFILMMSLGSFYKVDEGERAVITWNGKVVGTADAGLHWKMPIIASVHRISIRNHVATFKKIEAYTRDQQTATISLVSVNYRIPSSAVVEVYSNYGNIEAVVELLLTRRIGESLERVFGQYNAETAVQNRERLGLDFANLIKGVQGPIEIISVQIENFSLPDEYESNITERMAEEVKVMRLKQTALQAVIEAEIAVTQAQAKADSQLATAKANAEAVRMQGDAEAAAIRAKGTALRDNAGLIELTKAERWDGVLPTTMLPNSAIPFLTR